MEAHRRVLLKCVRVVITMFTISSWVFIISLYTPIAIGRTPKHQPTIWHIYAWRRQVFREWQKACTRQRCGRHSTSTRNLWIPQHGWPQPTPYLNRKCKRGQTWHCTFLGWALMTAWCKTTFDNWSCPHHVYRSCHALLEIIIRVSLFLYSLHMLGMTILLTSCNATRHKLSSSQFSYVHITVVTSLYWYSHSSERYWPCEHASSTETDLIHLPARTSSLWRISLNNRTVSLRRKRINWASTGSKIAQLFFMPRYTCSETSFLGMALLESGTWTGQPRDCVSCPTQDVWEWNFQLRKTKWI